MILSALNRRVWSITDSTNFMAITRLGVDKFYNSDIAPIPLTIVIGLRARVNPIGIEIA